MNLPNRISLMRIFLAIIIIGILIFPFDATGIITYKIFVNESIVIDIKYIIVGVLFIGASLTDMLDGHIARKYNMVTDLGKMLDSIADKILVNSILIILATGGFIHPIIPVIIVSADTIIDLIRMISAGKGKVNIPTKLIKIKDIFIIIGISLTLFYNLPFELFNIRIAEIFLIVTCILSIISAAEYYKLNKNLILKD